MPKRPYHKWYWSDWFAGTRGMDRRAKVWYFELIGRCWLDGGLPWDPSDNLHANCRQLARNLGATCMRDARSLHAHWVQLAPHFFFVNPTTLMNKRVFEDLKRYQSRAYSEAEAEAEAESYCAPPNVRTKGASSARKRGGPPDSIGRVLGAEEFERKRQGARKRLRRLKEGEA